MIPHRVMMVGERMDEEWQGRQHMRMMMLRLLGVVIIVVTLTITI